MMNDLTINPTEQTPAEHTPGPWEWNKLGGEWMLMTVNRGKLVVLAASLKNGRGSAQASPILRVRDHTRCYLVDLLPEHPDAKLIAAAPELLAACKTAAERGYTFGDLGDPAVEMPSRETLIQWSEDMFSLHIECQAAIDKATGSSPGIEEDKGYNA